MRGMRSGAVGWCLCVVVGSISGPGLVAQPAPDLERNPVTGCVESVDIASASGNRIRHVIDVGPGHKPTVTLASASAGERPRISIAPNGDSWVIWWEEGEPDRVLYRMRSGATGDWTQEVLVSDAGQDGRSPEIRHHAGAAWLAYESRDVSTVSVVVGSVIDNPEPIPPVTLVGSTSFTGDLDLQLHSEGSQLWLTWVDGPSAVGWSEFEDSTGSWSLPGYESYGGSSVAAAREAIRIAVLGE